MAVLGHVEQADPRAGVEPGVAVGKGGQRVHGVALVAEVTPVFEIGVSHLLALGGGVGHRRPIGRCDLGGRQRLGEQVLVSVCLLREVRRHTTSDRRRGPKPSGQRRRGSASPAITV